MFLFYNNCQSSPQAHEALTCIIVLIGISVAAAKPAPGISSVVPNSGSTIGGTSVPVNGANGGAAVSNGVVSTLASPPIVTSVSPKSGAAIGGTVVTINGSRFQAGATVSMG